VNKIGKEQSSYVSHEAFRCQNNLEKGYPKIWIENGMTLARDWKEIGRILKIAWKEIVERLERYSHQIVAMAQKCFPGRRFV
jgi:hypothetical protein